MNELVSIKNIVFLIIVCLISVFMITGCGKSDTELSDALKFKEEYESLNGTTRQKDNKTIRSITISEDNPFVYKTASELVKMIDNGDTFAVYFGFSDCPWCRSVLPTLVEVAKALDLKEIYYVDVADIRDVLELNGDEIKTTKKGTKGYYDLLDRLDSVLDEYKLYNGDKEVSTGEKRIYAPNIVTVVDGKPNNLVSGTSQKQTDGYMKITDEMKKETYDIFKCTLECITKRENTCSIEKQC